VTTAWRQGRAPFDDAGQMAGIEALPFGFLVFVAGALLMANAWAVVDAKLAATAAAREATRVYVEAGTGDDALQRAVAAARSSIAGHGRDPVDLGMTVDEGAGFGRCSRVTVEVHLAVPSVTLPFIGGFGRLFDVRASHSEIVDPFRSGLVGSANCAG
jgi:hypothetical protein